MKTPFIKLACLSAALICSLPSASHAGDVTPYVNVGIGLIDDQSREDFNGLFTGMVRGGVELNRYFALEAEGHIGLGENEEVFIGSPERQDEFQSSIDFKLGVFAVGKIPLSDAVALHGRAGYGFYQSSVSVDQFFQGENSGTIEDTIENNGATIGLGGEYLFGASKVNGIRFDASLLIDPDDDDENESGLPLFDIVPGLSLSYVRKF